MSAQSAPTPGGVFQHLIPRVDWYTALSRGGRYAFWAVAGGYILNAYDSAGLSFIITAVTTAFGLSAAQAGLLATVSVLATALGGTLAGTLADRFGRVRVLLISIMSFGLCNFLAGWAQSYEQLLLLRTLQGLGFGGLYAAGSVLMAEYSEASQRGRVLGMIQSAYAFGYVFLLIAYPLAFHLAPPELAWRIVLWLGVLPVLPLFWLLLRVPESPVFQAAHRAPVRGAEPAARTQFSLLRLFRSDLLAITLAATLLSFGARGGGTDFWIPSYLEQVHRLAPESISLFMGIMVIGSILGAAGGGFAVDWMGRRRGMALFALASALTVWAWTAVPRGDNALLLLLGLPYAFFTSGTLAGLGAYLSELFPTAVRGAGQGFTLNLGEIGRAVGPLAVGLVVSNVGLGGAIDLAGATYLLCLIALLFLPETKGKNLDAEPEATPA